jgi:hypothetical protein
LTLLLLLLQLTQLQLTLLLLLQLIQLLKPSKIFSYGKQSLKSFRFHGTAFLFNILVINVLYYALFSGL